MYEKTILLFILVNIPIICFYNQLVKFININDIPDNSQIMGYPATTLKNFIKKNKINEK